MLLVVGAQPAIVGTAVVRPALELERQVAWFQIVLAALEVRGVGRDQRLLSAVLRATFQEIDVVALDLDLRRHEPQARLAKRGRLSVEAVAFSGPDEVHGRVRSSRYCRPT